MGAIKETFLTSQSARDISVVIYNTILNYGGGWYRENILSDQRYLVVTHF